jgi:hypothetical protein
MASPKDDVREEAQTDLPVEDLELTGEQAEGIRGGDGKAPNPAEQTIGTQGLGLRMRAIERDPSIAGR